MLIAADRISILTLQMVLKEPAILVAELSNSYYRLLLNVVGIKACVKGN